MNTNSNLYTIIYSTILVVVVAALLAFVSTSLRERQQKNEDTETRTTILMSVNLVDNVKGVENLNRFIEDLFNRYITESFVIDHMGNIKDGEAFNISLKEQYDIMKTLGDETDSQKLNKLSLPVYICTLDNGEKITILSVYGAGLWGPIWGYISVQEDINTLYGATFGHSGETPGLGAEIATSAFSNQFKGKEIYRNGGFSPVMIKKGGATAGSNSEIDAISGGTITSNALEKTISMWLHHYAPFLERLKDEVDKNEDIEINSENPIEDHHE